MHGSAGARMGEVEAVPGDGAARKGDDGTAPGVVLERSGDPTEASASDPLHVPSPPRARPPSSGIGSTLALRCGVALRIGDRRPSWTVLAARGALHVGFAASVSLEVGHRASGQVPVKRPTIVSLAQSRPIRNDHNRNAGTR